MGFAVLAHHKPLFICPSDGTSCAVITRVSATSPEGKNRIGAQTRGWTFDASDRLPNRFTLRPGEIRTTSVFLDLPIGEYQFIAGYGWRSPRWTVRSFQCSFVRCVQPKRICARPGFRRVTSNRHLGLGFGRRACSSTPEEAGANSAVVASWDGSSGRLNLDPSSLLALCVNALVRLLLATAQQWSFL